MMARSLFPPATKAMSMFGRLAMVVLVATAMGCESSPPAGPVLVPAEGVVTFKDKPLIGATVFFYPENREGASCGGNTDETGKFKLWTNAKAGAAPGRYLVTVKCYTKKDGSPLVVTDDDRAKGMDEEQLISAGIAKLCVPVKYLNRDTTTLNVEVMSTNAGPIQIAMK